MKNLPLGIQTFRKIIEENYLYVDKTRKITMLLRSLFTSIPYNLHSKDEKYYHSLCYMILTLMGAEIDTEVYHLGVGGFGEKQIECRCRKVSD